MVSVLRPYVLVFLICVASHAAAATETYRGLLIPRTKEPPIPVTIELEEARGKLSGRVTTSPPVTGDGRFVARAKATHQCDFKTDIGAGRTLTFDGYCLPRTLEGKYILRFANGTTGDGDFRLSRVESAKVAPRKDSDTVSPQPVWTTTGCLSANHMCLAGCPRGDYNAEFICANRCRQRLAACKAKVAATQNPPESISPSVP